MRSIPPALLIALLAGCWGTSRLGTRARHGPGLNYAQVRSLRGGMGAAEILKAFGPPSDRLVKEGKLRGLTYPCEDSTGRPARLKMVFDVRGRLARWALNRPGK